jgi:hypothetical protein
MPRELAKNSATITLDSLIVINKAPFDGDTLSLHLGEINLKCPSRNYLKVKVGD